MQILATPDQLHAWRSSVGFAAFVPTMGNLHAGHIALCHEARRLVQPTGGSVVCSIFVNPLQFGPNEDLATYPRTFEEDCRKLQQAGVDAVFHPDVAALYPYGEQTCFVEPPDALQNGHCGAFRPGHFRGVATVVDKLFHLVQPDVAVFGRKDYQQLKVIETMVRELDMPVQLVGVPTQRAADGLALSSRNGYLDPAEREEAPELYRMLQEMAAAIHAGARNYVEMQQHAMDRLTARGWQPDYIHIVDQQRLLPAAPAEQALVILAAARLGRTRLIDNIEITLCLPMK